MRLGVMDLLQVQDLSPNALCEALDVPSNLMAHHLGVLQDAGLILRRRSDGDGRRSYVTAVPEAVGDLLQPGPPYQASRVVFVCTANTARSVLAEAIWHEHSTVPAVSAGTHPADRVNPATVRAAKRAGLTVVKATPTSLDSALRKGDLVVSVCDNVNEELSDIAAPHVHWSVPDPVAAGSDTAFDTTVADLETRVQQLATRVQRTRRGA